MSDIIIMTGWLTGLVTAAVAAMRLLLWACLMLTRKAWSGSSAGII